MMQAIVYIVTFGTLISINVQYYTMAIQMKKANARLNKLNSLQWFAQTEGGSKAK